MDATCCTVTSRLLGVQAPLNQTGLGSRFGSSSPSNRPVAIILVGEASAVTIVLNGFLKCIALPIFSPLVVLFCYSSPGFRRNLFKTGGHRHRCIDFGSPFSPSINSPTGWCQQFFHRNSMCSWSMAAASIALGPCTDVHWLLLLERSSVMIVVIFSRDGALELVFFIARHLRTSLMVC